MRYLQRMNRERPNLEAFSRSHFTQVRIVKKLMLIELIFNISQRELSPPDGHIQFTENPGQRSDMILVPMRQDDAANKVAIFQQIRNIGDNNIDAQQLGLGKHEPAIDNNDVIAVADGHAVHAELAHPAERNYMQFACWH